MEPSEATSLIGRRASSSPVDTEIHTTLPWIQRFFGGGWHHRTAELLQNQSRILKENQDSELAEGHNLIEIFEELQNRDGESRQSIILSIFTIIAHLFTGVFAMVYLEGWHPRDAAYFCIVTITTVGYGDLSPSKTVSKIFVIIYVILSIGIITSYLSYFIGLFLDEQEHMLFKKSIERKESELNEILEEDLDAQILFATEAVDVEDLYHLIFSAGMLFLVGSIGAYVFMRFEELGFLDSLYLIVISASTVGFGDQHPKHPVSRYIMTVWLIFATISLGNFVGEITRVRLKSKQRALTRRVLTAPIDDKSLEELDSTNTGEISWGDFLAAMLVNVGQVDAKDIEAYRIRFNELNPDLNGLVKVSSLRNR